MDAVLFLLTTTSRRRERGRLRLLVCVWGAPAGEGLSQCARCPAAARPAHVLPYPPPRPAPPAIRIFIAGYVWMTGFGNFSYYYRTGDFGVGRFCQTMWRLNFLVFFCCVVLQNEYMLYYSEALPARPPASSRRRRGGVGPAAVLPSGAGLCRRAVGGLNPRRPHSPPAPLTARHPPPRSLPHAHAVHRHGVRRACARAAAQQEPPLGCGRSQPRRPPPPRARRRHPAAALRCRLARPPCTP